MSSEEYKTRVNAISRNYVALTGEKLVVHESLFKSMTKLGLDVSNVQVQKMLPT